MHVLLNEATIAQSVPFRVKAKKCQRRPTQLGLLNSTSYYPDINPERWDAFRGGLGIIDLSHVRAFKYCTCAFIKSASERNVYHRSSMV